MPKKTCHPHEIVLGDESGTDNALGILERLRNEYEKLKIVYASSPGGYGYALFCAIYETNGD